VPDSATSVAAVAARSVAVWCMLIALESKPIWSLQ
jgi:hypothetical protein